MEKIWGDCKKPPFEKKYSEIKNCRHYISIQLLSTFEGKQILFLKLSKVTQRIFRTCMIRGCEKFDNSFYFKFLVQCDTLYDRGLDIYSFNKRTPLPLSIQFFFNFFFAFPLHLFAAVIDLPMELLPVQKFLRKHL